MESRSIAPDQVRDLDDVFGEDAGGIVSILNGILYWGVIALGFAVPIAGAIWGSTH